MLIVVTFFCKKSRVDYFLEQLPHQTDYFKGNVHACGEFLIFLPASYITHVTRKSVGLQKKKGCNSKLN